MAPCQSPRASCTRKLAHRVARGAGRATQRRGDDRVAHEGQALGQRRRGRGVERRHGCGQRGHSAARRCAPRRPTPPASPAAPRTGPRRQRQRDAAARSRRSSASEPSAPKIPEHSAGPPRASSAAGTAPACASGASATSASSHAFAQRPRQRGRRAGRGRRPWCPAPSMASAYLHPDPAVSETAGHNGAVPPLPSIDEARAILLAAVRPLPRPTSTCPTRSASCWPRTSSPPRTCPRSPTARWTASRSAPDWPASGCGSPASPARATPYAGTLVDGEAIRISTGAALPAGADGVLPIELVDGRRRRGASCDEAVAPGRNVRDAGDDLRAGTTVLRAGTRIGPAELGAAIGAGRMALLAAPRPRAGGRDDRRRAGRARRAAAARPDPRLQRPDARRAGRARRRRGHRPRPRDRRPRGDPRRARRGARGRRRPDPLRRRLGRPARPRQARARRPRRPRAAVARRAAAGQADLAGRARRQARLRPAGQPGLGLRHIPAVRPASAQRAAGRRRDRAADPAHRWPSTSSAIQTATSACGSGAAPTARSSRPDRRDRTCCRRCWAPTRWRSCRAARARSRPATEVVLEPV